MADPALAAFEAERDRLARLTRKGIGMPAAAFLLRALPQRTARFALTGVVFPLGALLTRLAVATTLVVAAAVIVTRSPLTTTAPLFAAACYAVAIVVLWREVGALTGKERGA